MLRRDLVEVRIARLVANKAKLVAGTKTLHHLLPDLVVPMDRAWTGRFFQLHPPEWQDQDNQRRTFRRVYGHLADVARRTNPDQYVTGEGWHTSRTKILDNALIGFCRLEVGDPRPTAEPASNMVSFSVVGYPPAKNEARSLFNTDHTYAKRVRDLLVVAQGACQKQAFTPIAEGGVGLDVVVNVPTDQPPWDATNYLGGIADVLEDKSRRGSLDHLGPLASVWLYRDDRQIKEISYREIASVRAAYTVTVRALTPPDTDRSPDPISPPDRTRRRAGFPEEIRTE